MVIYRTIASVTVGRVKLSQIERPALEEAGELIQVSLITDQDACAGT